MPHFDGRTAKNRVSDVNPTAPSLEGAQAALDAAERRASFWHEHHGEFLERYPEQFVAVSEGQVVAADSDLDKLLGILQSSGVDPRQVWLELITADVRRVIP